jgi:histone deacetylase complex regulatory component SIN3
MDSWVEKIKDTAPTDWTNTSPLASDEVSQDTLESRCSFLPLSEEEN